MDFRNQAANSDQPLAAEIASLSVLDDPVRAAVYAHVARSGGPVSRDQVAAALGVPRRVAAFHLDRLAGAGWLEISFRRLSGRTGPGAGRSSKLYRRSARVVKVSLPARNYELLARLFARGLGRHRRAALEDLRLAAYESGRQLGASVRAETGPPATPDAAAHVIQGELAKLGFEPFPDGSAIKLRNCPFHELATDDKELVCGSNLALMQGFTDGLEVAALTPVFEQEEGMCCVAFRPAAETVASDPPR